MVGAGTAGSVIVRRLVDAGHSVAVVEAGPSDTREEIADPLRGAALLGGEVDWAFSTEPQPNANNRVMYQARGKTPGGTSVFNGMVYVRGAQSDYDAWATGDATGWAWHDVEPYFRKLEAYDGPCDAVRGHDGSVSIQHNPDPNPLVRAFVDAAIQAGYPYNDDYNSGDSRGASLVQHTFKQGRRVTAWRAYVGPVIDSSLLRVITDARVSRILIEGRRAAGVEYLRDGQRQVIRAGQEVILSAGVFGTPQICQHAGRRGLDEPEYRGPPGGPGGHQATVPQAGQVLGHRRPRQPQPGDKVGHPHRADRQAANDHQPRGIAQ